MKLDIDSIYGIILYTNIENERWIEEVESGVKHLNQGSTLLVM